MADTNLVKPRSQGAPGIDRGLAETNISAGCAGLKVPRDEKTGAWRTKQEIALHFQIGVRTVNKLMNQRILPFSKVGHLVRFRVISCERALEFFKVASWAAVEPWANELQPQQWKTKLQLADHLGVSARTITSMMKRRVLPYLKIGQLVRFNFADCDRAMDLAGTPSILARRFKRFAFQKDSRAIGLAPKR